MSLFLLVLIIVLLSALFQLLLQRSFLPCQTYLVYVPHVSSTLGKLEQRLQLALHIFVLFLKIFLY